MEESYQTNFPKEVQVSIEDVIEQDWAVSPQPEVPVDPVVPSVPAVHVDTVDTVDTADTAGTAEPIDTAGTAEPIDIAGTAEPIDRGELVEPVEPVASSPKVKRKAKKKKAPLKKATLKKALQKKSKTVIKGNYPSDVSKITTNYLFKEALKYDPKVHEVHPVLRILNEMKQSKKFEAGWLRQNEAILTNREIPKPRSFLSDVERELVLKLALPLKVMGIPINNRLSWAWGIAMQSINRMIVRAQESETLTVTRKKRKDAGATLMNSEKKRAAVITDYHIFKKVVIKEHREARLAKDSKDGDENSKPLSTQEIKEMWKNLPQHERQKYQDIAERHRTKNKTLVSELEKVLQEGGPEKNFSLRKIVKEFSSDVFVPITSNNSLSKQLKMMSSPSWSTTKNLQMESMDEDANDHCPLAVDVTEPDA